ncbi:TetR/AcrR family transcriptional regulator [Nonomuraea aridisoli]|uniref:TetR/AcrR family transcriptional regulator n=1 Tax=Nonomuraea aridisoli TaxID=2070368 RepID=UPI0015E8CB65|nr:TetR/AcrR family transcriptional regulator [Nonomuraea aridisoli]
MTVPARGNAERVDRIIDASAELLSQRGYRRVTVEEIASRAGVSKSSVYLHWNTKDEIFYDVFDREFTVLAWAAVDHVRRDPIQVLAHRTAVNLMRIITERPLLKALLIDDRLTLGSLRPEKSPVILSRLAAGKELMYRYLGALRRHHLLCPEVDPHIMRTATCEMLRGMAFSAGPQQEGLRSSELARCVMVTVQRAFEPRTVPEPDWISHAAAEVFEAFDELMEPGQPMHVERSMAL